MIFINYKHVMIDAWDEFCKATLNNQILQTFLFGSLSGSLVYGFNFVGNQIYNAIYSTFRSDVTINNSDPNYDAVVDYITDNFLHCSDGHKSSMQVSTRKKKKSWRDYRDQYMDITRKVIPQLDVRPNNQGGFVNFTYCGVDITFYRKKGETLTIGWERRPHVVESLTLATWGRDNSIIIKLINAAVQANLDKNDHGVAIYVQSTSGRGGFQRAFTRKPRSQESVILDVDNASTLLEDARNFLAKNKWYNDMGIPYRRGYLLHGPPGCGKTSFALVLASELKLNICILNLSEKDLTDNTLTENLREAPSNAIILLEDVDSVFVERVTSKDGKSGVSFSGLLIRHRNKFMCSVAYTLYDKSLLTTEEKLKKKQQYFFTRVDQR